MPTCQALLPESKQSAMHSVQAAIQSAIYAMLFH